MPLRYYVFDAFTTSAFKGNPAAVVFLPQNYNTAIPDELLQSIASEFNLAETAFVSPRSDLGHYDLRWFTPTIEFPLCGHATLSAAAAIFLDESQRTVTELLFHTLSGILHARQLALPDGRFELDFPTGDVITLSVADDERVANVLIQAFPPASEVSIKFIGTGSGISFEHYLLVEVDGVSLRGIQVDSAPLIALRPRWEVIIFTQRHSPKDSRESDDITPHFVSRVFCPLEAIPEDPVTGSAHCLLGPYWARRLNFSSHTHSSDIPELRGAQVSSRSGNVGIVLDEEGNMCHLRGSVTLVAKGEFTKYKFILFTILSAELYVDRRVPWRRIQDVKEFIIAIGFAGTASTITPVELLSMSPGSPGQSCYSGQYIDDELMSMSLLATKCQI